MRVNPPELFLFIFILVVLPLSLVFDKRYHGTQLDPMNPHRIAETTPSGLDRFIHPTFTEFVKNTPNVVLIAGVIGAALGLLIDLIRLRRTVNDERRIGKYLMISLFYSGIMILLFCLAHGFYTALPPSVYRSISAILLLGAFSAFFSCSYLFANIAMIVISFIVFRSANLLGWMDFVASVLDGHSPLWLQWGCAILSLGVPSYSIIAGSSSNLFD